MFWKNIFNKTCSSSNKSKRLVKSAQDAPAQALVNDWYLFGIRVVRIRNFHSLSRVDIFGLPLLQIRYFAHKTCWYFGKFEILKHRISGPKTGCSQNGPLVLSPGYCSSARRLFWNIGPLAFKNEVSGVSRVVQSLLRGLMSMPSSGYEVCPVYTTMDMMGFVHARSFLLREKNSEDTALDEPVIFRNGDILVNPIPDVREVETHFYALKTLQGMGVKVLFFVHDLIPLRYPTFCPDMFREDFVQWLPLVSRFDGIVAVSQSVAEDYKAWRKENIKGDKPFFVTWFHLGADMKKVPLSRGIPENAEEVFFAMKARPTFLEVSTVEVRKGYGQAFAAFELLWAKGIDANFVMVGRKGWKVDKLTEAIDKHPENGKRLFWLKGISDEYLDKVYEAASCVLFPSEAEGFGLAVVEGAWHGKPLILRDIPVFREIAGDHAAYFSGLEPQALAECLERWLKDWERGCVIPSDGIKPLTWEESAQILLSRLPVTEEN